VVSPAVAEKPAGTQTAASRLYDTYAEGYARKCPRCQTKHSNGRLAIECWYLDDPAGVNGKSVRQIAHVMGLSRDTVSAACRMLAEKYGAPPRSSQADREVGSAYFTVLRFIRQQRQKRHGLPRGWSAMLARQCGVTRQRICQLARKAEKRGDL
jgi:hypothetical protein